ncbi:MAG: hypothetical protein Q9195_001015 [Heterodermia aff. obscurata]
MDAFNSSDIEVEPEPQTNHGAKSIKKLEALDPMGLRSKLLPERIYDSYLLIQSLVIVASKKASKSLSLEKGVDAKRGLALWKNRWLAFEKTVLGRPQPETPSGEDIVRFLSQIPVMMEPVGDEENGGIISMSTVRNGVRVLIKYFKFTHTDFELSESEQLRIRTLLFSMRSEGKITSKMKRTRQWLGVTATRAMSRAVLNKALTQGAYNWDVTLYRTFSMVFASALGARFGDIGLSGGYETEYMKYSHLRVVMWSLPNGEETIGMHVDLAYTKGHKLDSTSRLVSLSALTNDEDAVICPIRLLLVHALRIGNVLNAANYADVIRNIRRGRSMTLPWAHPEWPVLCGIQKGGNGLEPERTAPHSQLTNSIRNAAELAGILALAVPHDFRRGFFRDLSYAENRDFAGTATEAIAIAGGHTRHAFGKGLTDEYVGGGTHDDVYTKRVQAPKRLNDPRAVAMEPDRPFKKRHLTSEEVNARCDQMGLDRSVKKHRRLACARVHKDLRKQWREAATNDAVPEEQPPPQTLSVAGPGDKAPTSAFVDTAFFEDTYLDPHTVDPALFNPTELDASLQRETSPSSFLDVAADADEPIEDMVSNILGNDDPVVVDAIIEKCEMAGKHGDTASLNLSIEAFVDKYATINVVRQMSATLQKEHNMTDNKEERTAFISNCKNHGFGCPYTGIAYLVKHHELEVCKYTSAEVGQAIMEANAAKVPCLEGCGKRFKSHKILKMHHRDYHRKYEQEFRPQQCPDCSDEQVYHDRLEYLQHRSDLHLTASNYIPTACPVEGCKRGPYVYKSKDALYKHLHFKHKEVKKDVLANLPKAETRPTTEEH